MDTCTSDGVGVSGSLPAVNHHGSSVWRVAGLDPAEEGQRYGGIFWHSMIRPGHELELSDLPLLIGAILLGQRKQL